LRGILPTLIGILPMFAAAPSGFAADAQTNPTSPSSTPASIQTLDPAALGKLFGPLARDLTVALSMDGPTNGSVVYSRAALKAEFSGRTEFMQDGERRAANFHVDGAVLIINPPLELGASYTLATWIKLPAPASNAAIFQSAGDSILEIKDGKFGCNRQSVHRVYAPCDSTLVGWHHLAITCDGHRMLFYLDGTERGDHSWTMTMNSGLKSIGNHANPKFETAPCGGLDDVLIFNRELNGRDIVKVMQIRLPVSTAAQ
jgi:hypothetical protein